ncbi:MAG: Rrf2 family transcriptional regulator [Breznakibacter sp.]
MFNKETEYALRALVYIQIRNSENEKPSILEIAQEIEAPPFYIAKILQRLVKLGLLNSLKGKGGGFFFDAQKEPVTLMQVIESTEGSKLFCGCGLGLKNCDENNPCPIHDQFMVIRNHIRQLVQGETIQSLAKRTHDHKLALNRLIG